MCLRRAAVASGTGPAAASYDVDAAFMLLQVHGWDIHAVRTGRRARYSGKNAASRP
jgi:hypothetical protein